jgi:hypothetical protein
MVHEQGGNGRKALRDRVGTQELHGRIPVGQTGHGRQELPNVLVLAGRSISFLWRDGRALYWWENAASNELVGRDQIFERINFTASSAPCRRSMPASSHSIEIGPV